MSQCCPNSLIRRFAAPSPRRAERRALGMLTARAPRPAKRGEGGRRPGEGFVHRWLRGLVLAAIALVVTPLGAATQEFKPAIPDVMVMTQDGKSVRFYSDLVKGNAVAVNFVFTNCKTICPMLGGMFTNLQKQSVHGVRLISISIDSSVDTPQRLKAWGAKFNPGPSWTFVTGRQADIDQILKAFDAFTSRPQDHLPITIIGSDATGVWTRNYGFLSGPELATVITRVTDRAAQKAEGGGQ
jgi:protein SCO1